MLNRLLKSFKIICSASIIMASSLSAKNYRVLVIPSGGATGIIPAHIIADWEAKNAGRRFVEHFRFDEIWGASSGSITAAMLSLGQSGAEIVAFYKEAFPSMSEAITIMTRISAKMPSSLSLASPELKIPIRVLAYDEEKKRRHVFSTAKARAAGGEHNFVLNQCVQGSCRVKMVSHSIGILEALMKSADIAAIERMESNDEAAIAFKKLRGDIESWKGAVTCVGSGASMVCMDAGSDATDDFPGAGVNDPTADAMEQFAADMLTGDSLEVFFMGNGFTSFNRSAVDGVIKASVGKAISCQPLNVAFSSPELRGMPRMIYPAGGASPELLIKEAEAARTSSGFAAWMAALERPAGMVAAWSPLVAPSAESSSSAASTASTAKTSASTTAAASSSSSSSTTSWSSSSSSSSVSSGGCSGRAAESKLLSRPLTDKERVRLLSRYAKRSGFENHIHLPKGDVGGETAEAEAMVVNTDFVVKSAQSGMFLVVDLSDDPEGGFGNHMIQMHYTWGLAINHSSSGQAPLFSTWRDTVLHFLPKALGPNIDPVELAKPMTKCVLADPTQVQTRGRYIGYTAVWSNKFRQVIIGLLSENNHFEEKYWWRQDDGKPLTIEEARRILLPQLKGMRDYRRPDPTEAGTWENLYFSW